jgi:hypothetical protein
MVMEGEQALLMLVASCSMNVIWRPDISVEGRAVVSE